MEANQSEFNMAFSYLNRLNSLFYYASHHAMELNAHGWFHSVLAIYRELTPYIEDDEMKEKNKKMDEINFMISQNTKKHQQSGTNTIDTKLYREIHDFELFLRMVLKRTGLQMRMESDPSKALQ